MKIKLVRIAKQQTYTIGKLYIDEQYFCDTLEDTDRQLNDEMDVSEISKIKVYGKTAIPAGIYQIDMDTISPKFKNRSWAKVCEGKVPRLVQVKGFSGVLIHPSGNKPEDTDGCILVGQNKVKGQVINSTVTFTKLYADMKAAHDAGQEITIEIK